MNWLSPNPFSTNPKGPTFAQKRTELLQGLKDAGYEVTTVDKRTFRPLKVPYATSSDGRVRFWFKTQAIYYTVAYPGGHNLQNARSWTEDMRTTTVDELVRGAERET